MTSMILEAFKAAKQERVLGSMLDYLNYVPDEDDDAFDAGYTQADVDQCGQILDDYIDALAAADGDETAMLHCVEQVILALNALNQSTQSCLIETDQREDLCDYIQEATEAAGLPHTDLDLTYQWRQW